MLTLRRHVHSVITEADKGRASIAMLLEPELLNFFQFTPQDFLVNQSIMMTNQGPPLQQMLLVESMKQPKQTSSTNATTNATMTSTKTSTKAPKIPKSPIVTIPTPQHPATFPLAKGKNKKPSKLPQSSSWSYALE